MKNALFIIAGLLVIGMTACKESGGENVTKNGYTYTLFENGSGDLIQPGDVVFFNIVVRHDGDSIWQDSKDSPQQPELVMPADSQITSPNPVIDALKMMRLGDSIVINERVDTVQNLPPQMAGWKTINYSIVVTEIINESKKKMVTDQEVAVEAQVMEDIKAYNSGSLNGLQSTETGLKYIFHEKGSGAMNQKGEHVKVYYYGATVKDAKKFDSSYGRGTSFAVPLGAGQVISGWEEILLLLKKGDKVTVFIPGNLAYGKEGIPGFIGPDAELAFYIEVL